MVDYYKWSDTFGISVSRPVAPDSYPRVKRDSEFYKIVNKVYNNEKVQKHMREIKELKEDFSIQLELEKSRTNYERESNALCLEIYSLAIQTFCLTIWDAFIMFMDYIGTSEREHYRIWNLYKSNYPDEFAFV
jgi:hypothetical protein